MAQGVKHVHCVLCGRHVDVCGPLSRRYRCGRCRTDRLVENMTGLHTRRGVAYERWRSGMIRHAQRLLQGGM